jgi:predicted dehydrogenase
MDTIRWGIIGIGSIVNSSMGPGMLNDSHSEIVAVTSRDQDRADAFVEKFGAKVGYTDYDEMLANPEVDAILVTTPNSQHPHQVIAAAKAGKHVLCDKPMALSVADAVREIEACRAAGVKFDGNLSTLLEGQDETSTFYPQPSGQAHANNVAAFTASLLAGEEPNAAGIDGLHSMILVEAIAKSASEKRSVALDYSSVEALTRS